MTDDPRGIGDNHTPQWPLRRWRYPLKKQLFEEVGDGTVRVTCDDGRIGLFKADGTYISGDLTQASRQMLVWLTAPRLPEECDYRWNQVPVDLDRPSGWPERLEKTLAYQLGHTNEPPLNQ